MDSFKASEQKPIIRSVPFSKKRLCCPICKKRTDSRKIIKTLAFDKEKNEVLSFSCRLPFCDTCDIPFMDSDVENEIISERGCAPDRLDCSGKSLDRILAVVHPKRRKTEQQQKTKKTSTNTLKNSYIEYVPVQETVFLLPSTIIDTPSEILICPKCSSKTEKNYSLIPKNNRSMIKIKGFWCRKCNVLFSPGANQIEDILSKPPTNRHFTYIELQNWKTPEEQKKEQQRLSRIKRANEQKQRKKIEELERIKREKEGDYLSSIPSAEVMIIVRFDDGEEKRYIIITEERYANKDSIVYYKSQVGRELLSSAFSNHRESKGIINNRKYTVINKFFPRSHINALSEGFILSEIEIKSGGGFYTSALGYTFKKVVDSLVYSLRSNRYEIMRSTYDESTLMNCVDISLFRRFVEDYGKPDVLLFFDDSAKNQRKISHFSSLNPESKLHCYGYNVQERIGLSEAERHAILAEVVDLEIMSVTDIVRHLDYLIKRNTSESLFNARQKWDADKRFIQDYKVNPTRFLIVS